MDVNAIDIFSRNLLYNIDFLGNDSNIRYKKRVGNFGAKYQKECELGTCFYRCLLMGTNEEYSIVEAKSLEGDETIFYYMPLSLGDSSVLEIKELNSSGEEFTSIYKLFFR